MQNLPQGKYRSDTSGRTLLAWYRLKVMRYFMPGDVTCLLQPSDQAYGTRKGDYDKRGTEGGEIPAPPAETHGKAGAAE